MATIDNGGNGHETGDPSPILDRCHECRSVQEIAKAQRDARTAVHDITAMRASSHEDHEITRARLDGLGARLSDMQRAINGLVEIMNEIRTELACGR
jgi:hypothetical protein